MQEGCWCEVIGCEEQACWLLACREERPGGDLVGGEDFLCSAHWETLNHRDPQRASCYVHLSSLLAEGMGATGIVSTANLRHGDGSASIPETWKQKRNQEYYDQDRWRDPSDGDSPLPREHLSR